MFLLLHLSLATAISLSYIGFLYAFDFNGIDRNHPKSIKRRFCGAVVSNFISILATYFVLSQNHAEPFAVMGIHSRGIYSVLFFSYILTSCCYLGNWVMLWYDGQIITFFDLFEWKECFTSLSWFRDNVMAPVTEELAFRACTASLVREVFSPYLTVIIAPLPFSLSHFHHILDDAKKGCELWTAFKRRAFQAFYTYAFGCYATFLFVRTESVFSAIVSHSICNSMGLPMFNYIKQYQSRSTRIVLWTSYLTGFCIFLISLMPLTEPSLFKL